MRWAWVRELRDRNRLIVVPGPAATAYNRNRYNHSDLQPRTTATAATVAIYNRVQPFMQSASCSCWLMVTVIQFHVGALSVRGAA